MNCKARRIEEALRVICAVATSFATVLCLLGFGGICVEGVRLHAFDTHKPGLLIGLAIVGLLTFFSAHSAWRLWRGSLSSNGVTLMPTWFVQMFGAFYLAGIAFVAYHHPSYPLLAGGASIALAMIFFGRHVAKRKREFGHDASGTGRNVARFHHGSERG